MLPSNLYRDGFNREASGPININSLGTIRDFIRNNLEKRKTINNKKGSSGLKSAVERILKEVNGYIANGDFIASMILEGYKYKVYGPNANFNLSQKSIKEINDVAYKNEK